MTALCFRQPRLFDIGFGGPVEISYQGTEKLGSVFWAQRSNLRFDFRDIGGHGYLDGTRNCVSLARGILDR
jgi:hypothetical protein